jgi:hypothetical protein
MRNKAVRRGVLVWQQMNKSRTPKQGGALTLFYVLVECFHPFTMSARNPIYSIMSFRRKLALVSFSGH